MHIGLEVSPQHAENGVPDGCSDWRVQQNERVQVVALGAAARYIALPSLHKLQHLRLE